MAFVKFTEVGKSFSPRVSLGSRGLIGFNQGFCKRYATELYKACVLYYDAEAQRIAIEFTHDESAEGAIRLRNRTIGADLSAKSFLTYFNILPTETTSYEPDTDSRLGWIIIDLSKGREEPDKEEE